METISRKHAAAIAVGNDAFLLDPYAAGRPAAGDDRKAESAAGGPEPIIAAGSLGVIDRLGSVQIDTISVVTRAHAHILWSRNRSFTESDLDMLQGASRTAAPHGNPRRIFEYWTHAAAYLPLEDYRFCLPRMERIKRTGFDWYARNRAVMDSVLVRIRSEGELCAREFADERERPSGVWWDWKPAKIALEHLFMEGTIMVSRRENFQKVYDLTERILPSSVDTRLPSPDECADWLIRRAITALGIVSAQEITYLRRDGISEVPRRLSELTEEGAISRVNVEGLKRPYYTFPALLDAVSVQDASLPSGSAGEPILRVLSPFDPLVLSRKRLLELFGYSYTLECFLPKEKRKFGYFALPILCGSRIAGIMDARAARKEGKLVIQALSLEPFVKELPGFITVFDEELSAFARFNGCGRIEFSREAQGELRRGTPRRDSSSPPRRGTPRRRR